MNTRPAWGLLAFGALIVIGVFLSPLWLDQFSGYIEEEQAVAPFPDAFYDLPSQAQDTYIELYNSSQQMAVDMVAARLEEDLDIEEPNLPVIDPNPALVNELLTGNFVRMDSIRNAEGTASIYSLSDGTTIVRLENLNAINGPDVRVLLSAYPQPNTAEDLAEVAQFQLDLGVLKGNVGNQNYEITDPAFNIDNYLDGSVVLYSTRYDIIFSFAPLSVP